MIQVGDIEDLTESPTLLGLLPCLNRFLICRGSISDHKVSPKAASGAVTRTVKSRKVTVSLFLIWPFPPSKSTGVTVPEDGVSMARQYQMKFCAHCLWAKHH